MKNRYEGLLVLNTKGKDDTVKETIERLEGEIKKEGGTIEQVQRMERKQFSYAAGDLESGYFVNFIFAGESTLPTSSAPNSSSMPTFTASITRNCRSSPLWLRSGRPVKRPLQRNN